VNGSILISDEIEELYGDAIEAAAPGAPHVVVHPGRIDGDPSGAEIAFFSNELFPDRAGEFIPQVIASVKAGALAWFHTFSAGVDDGFFQGLLERGVRLTTSSGAMAVPIAHSVMAHLLTFSQRLTDFQAAQSRREWQPRVLRELEGSVLGVVGLGAIGLEVARLGQAFRMEVVGFRRTPRGDEPCPALPSAKLDEWLPRIDYLVLALPLGAESHHLIDAAALAKMKRHSIIVNIARGGVIDEAALIDALERRAIGGAALDVFEQEPLPNASPLWTLPNVIVTPHCSGDTAGNRGRACEIFLDNLARYVRGESLRNEVTSSITPNSATSSDATAPPAARS
jgi:phosphoglycerate dehydrogenase-like enzyme